MNGVARSLAIALASFLTSALLFGACSPERQAPPDGGLGVTPPRAAAPSAAPASQTTSAVASAPRVAAARAQGAQNPAVWVYQQNGASVVNITSVAVVRTGLGLAEQPRGTGSGFILDRQGRIVTNNHVVEDADQLSVTFQDGTTVPAQLLGRDPDNDLAVIQVDVNATDEAGLPIRDRIRPVTLGDSDRITIGEDAIAIGSPLGLRQTVTAGIVSALRHPGEETGMGQIDLLGGAVQTDAPINPGNSGGPLFNALGEVIGVNTAILSGSGGNIGIGFAIPVNVVKRVTPELIQTGRYRHPFLGIGALPLSALGQAARRQLGIPQGLNGLLVQEVTAGAQQAGIRPGNRVVVIGTERIRVGGDIIIAIDGQPVRTGGQLRGWIENNKHPGDTVTLTILRDGQRLEVQVRLTERPRQ